MDDWNWFFSALPQSAAAIVGLGGAFLVTKIAGNESEYKRNVSAAQESLDEAERLEDKANQRYFEWYNRHSRKADLDRLWKKLDKQRDSDDGFLSASEYYEQASISPFIPRSEIITEIEELIDLARQPPPPVNAGFGGPVSAPADLFAHLDQQLSVQLQEERELIDQLVIEVDHHARSVRRLLGSLRDDPESSSVISWAIAANLSLFFIGIVYPLGWLPLSGPPVVSFAASAVLSAVLSMRGALLVAFSTVFCVLMLRLWRANARLRYSPELLEQLERRSSRGSYSKWLGILDENERSACPADTALQIAEGPA